MAKPSTRAGYSATLLYTRATWRRTKKVVGYETPQARFYCPECAKRLGKVAESTPIRANETTDWNISCERCQETILDAPED